jgi:hypothetical protein
MKSGENCSCQVLFDDPLRDDDTTPAKTMRWYLLIRSLLWDGVERFPKSARLHLLNAFIHQDKLKNKFKALHELMRTEESRPTFQQDFLIYRFKHQIE